MEISHLDDSGISCVDHFYDDSKMSTFYNRIKDKFEGIPIDIIASRSHKLYEKAAENINLHTVEQSFAHLFSQVAAKRILPKNSGSFNATNTSKKSITTCDGSKSCVSGNHKLSLVNGTSGSGKVPTAHNSNYRHTSIKNHPSHSSTHEDDVELHGIYPESNAGCPNLSSDHACLPVDYSRSKSSKFQRKSDFSESSSDVNDQVIYHFKKSKLNRNNKAGSTVLHRSGQKAKSLLVSQSNSHENSDQCMLLEKSKRPLIQRRSRKSSNSTPSKRSSKRTNLCEKVKTLTALQRKSQESFYHSSSELEDSESDFIPSPRKKFNLSNRTTNSSCNAKHQRISLGNFDQSTDMEKNDVHVKSLNKKARFTADNEIIDQFFSCESTLKMIPKSTYKIKPIPVKKSKDRSGVTESKHNRRKLSSSTKSRQFKHLETNKSKDSSKLHSVSTKHFGHTDSDISIIAYSKKLAQNGQDSNNNKMPGVINAHDPVQSSEKLNSSYRDRKHMTAKTNKKQENLPRRRSDRIAARNSTGHKCDCCEDSQSQDKNHTNKIKKRYQKKSPCVVPYATPKKMDHCDISCSVFYSNSKTKVSQ